MRVFYFYNFYIFVIGKYVTQYIFLFSTFQDIKSKAVACLQQPVNPATRVHFEAFIYPTFRFNIDFDHFLYVWCSLA